MTTNQKSNLQSKGWNVVKNGTEYFVYRHGTKATEFPFDEVDKAWDWLQTFLETI